MKLETKYAILILASWFGFGAIWYLIIPLLFLKRSNSEELIIFEYTILGIDGDNWYTSGYYITFAIIVLSILLVVYLLKKKK
jgi:hypothetical protein